jgi:hypothetical protein
MARGKSSRGNGGELYETPSGLVHAAASLTDLPRGKYVQHFGAPGDPQQKSSVQGSGYPGRQSPGTMFLQGKKGKK